MKLSGTKRRSLLRLVDANANRALEGLRVCEEIVRFHWQSPRTFRKLRSLRHSIAEAVRQLPFEPTEFLQARNSSDDIGRNARSSSLDSLEHLLVVNFQRVKEALRTLEECTRLLPRRHTLSFQRLRFRTYEVEREILLTLASIRHH